MSWKVFCPGCFKFIGGGAPSDYAGPKGESGHCPYCNRELTMADEDDPPRR